LLLDGHSSHFCPDTVRLAAQEQVIVFALPPNTTHLSQPLDKGCFGPLKAEWRNVCHRYISEHPGKVVTRFTFSRLFCQAWMKSMTIGNIVGGFRVTGIYPINRSVFTELTGPKESLTCKTGLAFIPLYSPARHSRKVTSDTPSFSEEEITKFKARFENGYNLMHDERYNCWLRKYHPDEVPLKPHSPAQHPRKVTSDVPSFSEKEITKFETRFGNGYDLLHDERYNCWLRKYHPDEAPLQPPVGGGGILMGESPTSQSPLCLDVDDHMHDEQDRVLMPTAPSASISRFLYYPPPPSQLPTLKPKSSGRVLTSAENLKIIENKQQEKEAKAREKEERKQRREEMMKRKQQEKEAKARLKEEQRQRREEMMTRKQQEKEAKARQKEEQRQRLEKARKKARKGVQAASGGGERGVHGELTDVVFFLGWSLHMVEL